MGKVHFYIAGSANVCGSRASSATQVQAAVTCAKCAAALAKREQAARSK